MSNKIAIITDQHFGVKRNQDFMLDYQEKFYNDLFFPTLKKENVSIILNGGDIFDDRKSVNIKTLKRTNDMFIDRIDIPMYIIPGNHDVFHKNSNETNSLNECVRHNTHVRIIDRPTKLSLDNNVTLSMIPWINNSNYSDTMKYIQNDDAQICLGHFEFSGFEMYKGSTNEYGMDHKMFGKYEQVWSGHFHTKSSKDNIHYLGAPMEFTWGDCNDERGFHIFDTETKQLTYIKNPYNLHEKIFYDDTKEININVDDFNNKIVNLFVVNKKDKVKFDNLIDNFNRIDTISFTVFEDTVSDFMSENVDVESNGQSTQELITEYVDGVDTEMDKTKIKNILKSLYTEAIAIE